MIDFFIQHHLNILFIGINPHHGSYRRGVPFSNNKMFWYLLHEAGLLLENRDYLKNDAQLKDLYENHFAQEYGFAIINIIDRPTTDVSELKRGEETHGVERLREIIHTYQPRVVCFVGKLNYQLFINCKTCEYGWQPDIENSQIYVMHTPLRGHAAVRIAELQEIKHYFSTKYQVKNLKMGDKRDN